MAPKTSKRKFEGAEKRGWDLDTVLTINLTTREKVDQMYNAIQQKYGTVDYYLINKLGVDIAALRAKYLE